MFLNEAALGREHIIKANDSSLKEAPNGCDCVIAKGNQEPGMILGRMQTNSISVG